MSNLKITELGRKWYGISVSFANNEIERINPDVLRGLGGKLRYNQDGGLRALFHFNVTDKISGQQMTQVLTYFGKDGYFENGLPLTSRTTKDVTESAAAISKTTAEIKAKCRKWSEQWHEIAQTAVTRKQSRIEVLRKIHGLGLNHITEKKIRAFIENILRKKYTSDLFVETFMWRMGWPDKRKPLAKANPNIPLQSKLTSAS